MTRNNQAERERGIRYRAANADAIKARRRAQYLVNKDKILAAQKVWYEANKEAIRAQHEEYRARKSLELGENYGTVLTRRRRANNIEKVRKEARDAAARYYRAYPEKAAVKRAKTILSAQSGVPQKDLDPEIVTAKALQLLVRAVVHRPGRAVGQKLSSEEVRLRRAARWQDWYQRNKARRAEYSRNRRGASAMSAGTAETAQQAQGQRPASAVGAESDETPNPSSGQVQ